MKLVVWTTILLFAGHIIYSFMFHESINYEKVFERTWFQFCALVLYWFFKEKA